MALNVQERNKETFHHLELDPIFPLCRHPHRSWHSVQKLSMFPLTMTRVERRGAGRGERSNALDRFGWIDVIAH